MILECALVKNKKVVWDIGANAGFYTIAFSTLVGPGGRVYSFEPLAKNVSNLLRHIALNSASNVTVVSGAVTRYSGPIGFHVTGYDTTGRVDASLKEYVVQGWSIDDFVAAFPESTPELIKIDVEGAEAGLLEGASSLLKVMGPEIILAVHSHDLWRRCFDILSAHGYQLETLGGLRHEGPVNLEQEVVARKR